MLTLFARARLCVPALLLVVLAPVAPDSRSIAAAAVPRNVILIVPDGLRSVIVDRSTAPYLERLRRDGVSFANSHALFPTFTTANASAMATGHLLGDTGDFSNTVYAGRPIKNGRIFVSPTDEQFPEQSVTPFLEDDGVLRSMNEAFGGNYLGETSILAAARSAGYATAAIGKVGPVAIQDVTKLDGSGSVVVDDQTGSLFEVPIPGSVVGRLFNAGVGNDAPSRGDNGRSGSDAQPGTLAANWAQERYFTDVLTKALLPTFAAQRRPFAVVFWSRDPDGTQHNQGDSLDALVPGINGPTSREAIRNVDAAVGQIQLTLARLGLAANTDIIVAADHGFSTISKQSVTSTSTKLAFRGVPAQYLPPGFVAIDLAKLLGLRLLDPDREDGLDVDYEHAQIPAQGNAVLGMVPADRQVVVAANGGSDLIYVDRGHAPYVAKIVDYLLRQDYVSGLFVDESFGRYPGTLPLSAIGLVGSARTPRPTIAVNFRSFGTGCTQVLRCAAEVADTGLRQGQGMHGSFSRADTFNFMAAIGPDFKRGYVDAAPTSNADVGMTLAHLLKLQLPARGSLIGRVMSEALVGGAEPAYRRGELRSAPGPGGAVTVLRYQELGRGRYFDAAGKPGSTVGL